MTDSKPQKLNRSQKRQEWLNRTRTLRDGVWRLDLWQPHPKVPRGKPRKEAKP